METGEPPRTNVANRHVSIPRGGPVFVPDLISGITRVLDFESNVYREIETLKAELSSSHATPNEDEEEVEDISVDELKVFTDEELLDAATKEIFKCKQDSSETSNASPQQASDGGETNGVRPQDSFETSNASPQQTSDGGETNGVRPQKRKRQIKCKSKGKEMSVHDKNKADDEEYLLIAEKFAKVKQKQEQERKTVKLHSLVAKEGQTKNQSATLSSENSARIQSLLSLCNPMKVKPSHVGEHVAVMFPEVVLCVEVYHWKRTSQKIQEIMVLGCQFLTELRDNIYCLIDGVMQKAGQNDPSGYFLIEDVFYNDMRDPSAINYSTPILDWLKSNPERALEKWDCLLSGTSKLTRKVVLPELPVSRLPQFKAAEMHKVRFCDLKFRLGAGYLYCHQGDCKHTIIMRDMRLIHPEDVQNRASYPLVSYQQKFILTKCSVCKLYKATKVTLDDKWAGENPCYFCDNCYFLLHYGQDGSLLYDQFSVYQYLQDY